MALSFTRAWLWMGGKEKEQVSDGSFINSVNSLGDWGVGLGGENFYSLKGADKKMSPSTILRKSKRKWKSREERMRMVDKEYDVVLVPSDGYCLSGSESDDSDWSIGWLEPHAPDFQSDDDVADNSFAVLVPCYRHDCNGVQDEEVVEVPYISFLNLPIDHSPDCTKYMEQLFAYLQNV